SPASSKNSTKVTVNESISRLAFVSADGTMIWQREEVRQAPSYLKMKRDQSINDAVSEAMRPTSKFFKGVTLPRMLPKHSDAKGFGTSMLSAQGAVAAPEGSGRRGE